jgi:hypothetical protein
MDKKYLLETARQLTQPSDVTAGEYQQKEDTLLAGMNALMLERPDIVQLVGANNISMMKDNHANHIRFMTSMFRYHNPEVLVDTVLWVFRAYRSHGFTSNYWAAQLNGWITILKESLSGSSFREVYPFYEWMQINIPVFVEVSDNDSETNHSSSH